MFLKYFPGNVAAVITGLTALGFAVSAAREWTYYYGLGARDFLSLASPADYTRAALLWMPAFLLLVAVLVVLEMVVLRIEFRYRYEEKIVQRVPTPMRPWFDSRELLPASMLFGFFAASVLNVLVLSSDSELGAIEWLFLAYGCWIVFFTWFSHPYMEDRQTKKVTLFVPFIAAFSIVSGYDEARDDLARPSGEYRIVNSNGEVEDDVQLLRATSNGILILRVPTRDISFLTYASFNRMERVAPSQ